MQTHKLTTIAQFLAIGLFAGLAAAQQKTLAPGDFIAWLPVTDADRQSTAPVVEKDAGAEVLFWRVHVVDESLSVDLQRVFYHYIRIKVYDERGKDQVSTISIPYENNTSIISVSGRTIKADGSIVELQGNAVFKRDVERIAGYRRKEISFAMPAVEPGAIVEYRYKEIFNSAGFRYLRVAFSREFPVQKVTYYVIPLARTSEQMYVIPYNSTPSPVKHENDGYNSITAEKIPAFHQEPFSPSEPNIRPWALLYYRPDQPSKDFEKFWNGEGKRLYKEIKDVLKSSSEIKAAAVEAAAKGNTPAEKAAALIAQLQKSVRQFDDPSVTDAERAEVIKKMPKDRERTAAEVFKSGLATRNEMNMLFATMAQDAGLDARPARVADWNEVFFNPKNSNVSYMIRTDNVAVKTGADGWSIYDVSQRYLPPGALPWRHEGVFALVTDPKTPVFVQTPVSHAEASTTARTGKFTLTTDGTLEGDVEESVTGHRAEDRRSQLADQSESQRTEWLETRVRNMFPQSEVSKESWSDVEDPAKPLVIKYHVKAPHFAQITGRRILFHVNPLARSQGSPFTASLRRNPVQFPYAWKDQDRISIQLPDGFALDNADNPGDFGLGENGSYKLSIQIAKATNELKVSRDFSFGKAGGLVIFDPPTYPALKKAFDEIARRDQHMMALKEAR